MTIPTVQFQTISIIQKETPNPLAVTPRAPLSTPCQPLIYCQGADKLLKWNDTDIHLLGIPIFTNGYRLKEVKKQSLQITQYVLTTL